MLALVRLESLRLHDQGRQATLIHSARTRLPSLRSFYTKKNVKDRLAALAAVAPSTRMETD